MKNWYHTASKQQKIFLFVLAGLIALYSISSALTIPGLAIGMIPLALLVYLQLGSKPKQDQPIKPSHE